MSDLQKKLKKLKDLRQRPPRGYSSEIWKIGHDLADAGYLPAKDYFVKGLHDPTWVWREECITFLGFHYLLEDEVLDQIRELAITDPSSDVRLSAVAVLGSQSSLPDKSLTKALVSDTNKIVREVAFKEILRLCGVSREAIVREGRRIDANETQPTLELVKQVLEQEEVQITPEMLDPKG